MYLRAHTPEKVVIIAGPEFGERQGYIPVTRKTPHVLRSSRKLFGESIFELFDELGCTPSKAEPQIWMRENSGTYEYVATHGSDLLLATKGNPLEEKGETVFGKFMSTKDGSKENTSAIEVDTADGRDTNPHKTKMVRLYFDDNTFSLWIKKCCAYKYGAIKTNTLPCINGASMRDTSNYEAISSMENAYNDFVEILQKEPFKIMSAIMVKRKVDSNAVSDMLLMNNRGSRGSKSINVDSKSEYEQIVSRMDKENLNIKLTTSDKFSSYWRSAK